VQSPFELEKDSGGLILTIGKYYTPSGRLIQRDYSKTSFYDYILHRGAPPVDSSVKKDVFHTDSGRPIYGGGGITPDVTVEIPATYGRKVARWFNPIFGFTREVINGQVHGFEAYKVDRIKSDHVVQPNELTVTDQYLDAFKRYLAEHPEYKLSAADVDTDRDVLRNELRRELATAHFGLDTSTQVANLIDPQVQRAIREIPQAQKMAEVFKGRVANGVESASAK
jgi:carboxyl-terminal processing protease